MILHIALFMQVNISTILLCCIKPPINLFSVHHYVVLMWLFVYVKLFYKYQARST